MKVHKNLGLGTKNVISTQTYLIPTPSGSHSINSLSHMLPGGYDCKKDPLYIHYEI
jgi:hypothetical protein